MFAINVQIFSVFISKLEVACINKASGLNGLQCQGINGSPTTGVPSINTSYVRQ